jgi:ABC-type cobalamin/Fe3+-siderophores transport system ATPase subunit
MRANARERPVLRGSDLSYGYAGRRERATFTLHDVTVDVPRGSLTGLLGPNGCGKTTLLRLLAGILRPDSGMVTLAGRPMSELSRREIAQRIAVVPQETHPAFDYTVMEMVLMGRHPHLGPFELEGPHDLRLAHDALIATGTDHLANRPYMTLSGGEKQRVIIASALAQASDVLLLDEPTASLDLGYQLEVAALLTQLNAERGVTLLLATHDLNLAASVCDRLVLMREGRVVAQGATSDVLTAARVREIYGVVADVRYHDRAKHLTVTPVSRIP